MNKDDLIRAVRDAADAERLAGVTEFYRQPASSQEKVEEAGEPMTFESLKEKVSECTRCELANTRVNVVFGEGDPNADIMFVGEAPGADEDAQGRPFVGRAGQLLTKMIQAMGLKREDVFIANILKCRPPANRNPLPQEIAVCSPHLLKQIEIIKPKVICALGKFAAQTLLDSETPISKLRGSFYDYHGVRLMPTYHPAYLLRNSAGKVDVWNDLKAIAKELGIKIPKQEKEKN